MFIESLLHSSRGRKLRLLDRPAMWLHAQYLLRPPSYGHTSPPRPLALLPSCRHNPTAFPSFRLHSLCRISYTRVCRRILPAHARNSWPDCLDT